MSNNIRYPKILRDGELKAFNDRITTLLGTPIFFTAPGRLLRPKATDTIGILYEVISGLYVVYHDYGIRLFSTYRDFCKMHVTAVGFTQSDGFAHRTFGGVSNHEYVSSRVQHHCINVDHLRGGFFHGCLPNASEEGKTRRVMSHMTSGGTGPDDLATLTEQQATEMLGRLTDGSDKMFEYFERCATVIADPMNGGLLADWRGTLIQRAFNPDDPQYSQGTVYFDGRTINDIEESTRVGGQKKAYTQTVRDWLRSLDTPIRSGNLTSAQLHSTLKTAFMDLYDPYAPSAAASASGASVGGSSMAALLGADTVAKLFGFS